MARLAVLPTLKRIEKQPAEVIDIPFDFEARIATGETIASTTVTVTKVSDSSAATSTVYDTRTVGGAVVTARFKAGTSGEDYKITVLAVTSTSAKVEADCILVVKDE